MKPYPGNVSLRRIWRAAVGGLLLAGGLFAQSTGTGIIQGVVHNPNTGENLERARVTVEGTGLETFTDAGGQYRLAGVPAGNVQVRAFHTGVTSQTHAVTVAAGQTVRQDFELTSLSARPAAGQAVKLDAFVVSDPKEMTGAAIAINTQRFAPNILSVIAADEFGPMATANVGEVLKSLPGITMTQGGMGEPNTISVSGVPSAYVPVTVNGFAFAPAGGGTGRTVGVHMVSLNNVARVEVATTITPETPGSALGGTVNMVPRNAFERARPVYSVGASLLMRDDYISSGKSWAHRDERVHTVRPGFDFSAIVPVSRRFGFTFSAATAPLYTPLSLLEATWRGTSAPTTGTTFPDTTPDRPYLTTFSVRDATRMTRHTQYAATADFRLSDADTLSFSINYALFGWESNDRQINFTIERVDPGNFGPTFTHGAPGAGALLQFNAAQNVDDTLYMPTLIWRHHGSVWKAEAGAGVSHGERLRRDISQGSWANILANRPGVTIAFDDIRYDGPRSITVQTPQGERLDPYRLSTYNLLQATGNEIDFITDHRQLFASAQRSLGTRVPVAIKGGFDLQQQIRDVQVDAPVFPYLGPDGVAGGTDGVASVVLDEGFSQRDGPFYFPRIEWMSNEEAFRFGRENPAFFGPANAVTRHNSRVSQSKYAKEVIWAGYVRGDIDFLQGRLKVVGGVRLEQTNVEGQGDLLDPSLNFQRDASGRVVLGANGQPLPVVTDPLQVAQRTRIERGLLAEKEYLRWLPSINARYAIRENWVGRLGYYKSIGRPDFVQYAGSVTLPNTEAPPSATNRISINNAAIKPWMADTVKASLDYYFEGVGNVSVSGYIRRIENFFGSSVVDPTPEFLALYSLDPSIYGRYPVATQTNLQDTVRMSGVEATYKQALTFLPHWARGVQVFANYTIQRITGSATDSLAGMVPRFGNWGVSLSRPKYTLRARWNYRDEARQGPAAAGRGIEPGTYFWNSDRMIFDLTAEYKLTRHITLYGNLTNISDAPIDTEVRGPGTPGYALFRGRLQYGSQWLFGARATF